MLNEAIRLVLEEYDVEEASNEELAARVSEKISPEEREAALLEALRVLISSRRSLVNRKLLQEFRPSQVRTQARRTITGAREEGGVRYSSARNMVIENRMLQFTITGANGVRVPLSRANAADLRSEIDSSRKRGNSFLKRASIFDDMLHEMASAQVRSPGELPSESRAAYGLRMAELMN